MAVFVGFRRHLFRCHTHHVKQNPIRRHEDEIEQGEIADKVLHKITVGRGRGVRDARHFVDKAEKVVSE